jgi:3-methyladenine DNA glycosylase AlkD
VSDSKDMIFYELGIKNIEKLKHEKPVLITKAISWLLRSMVKNHKNEVEKYIKNNLESLPKIAIRETQKKLITGTK